MPAYSETPADTAYPCLQQVLTPYRENGNLTPTERHFNKQLSKCRVTIEHTFGMLKQRFRQLFHLKARKIEDMCHFIRACCVLHNLSMFDGFQFEYEDPNTLELQEPNQADVAEPVDLVGHNYRNYVAALMYNQ
nr:unnamed protein product [Callosobruchus analis]